MKAVILKCRQGARFHFGEFAQEQSTALYHTADYIHSDVLFGAFISALSTIYPEKTEDFKTYFENDNLSFSSAFYCIEKKDKNYVYLLPKPAILNLYRSGKSDFDAKRFKKIRFISKGVWEKGLSPDSWFDKDSPCCSPNDTCIFLKEELEDNAFFSLCKKDDTQKVKVRTDLKEDCLYSQTDLIIQGKDEYNVHWYFLYEESLPEKDKAIFKKTIELMNYNGIGGERSTGCGALHGIQFIETFEINVENKAVEIVSLALNFPREEDSSYLQYYQTKLRGGMRYGKDKRLQVITALLEGAVINHRLAPRIIDISEEGKTYWKYSGSLALPLPQTFKKAAL